MSSLVEVVDVVKQFGTMTALDHLSLKVDSGELLAIDGPSGSGKSTLMHLIAALDRPTSGTIRVDGRSLDELPSVDDYRRRTVGLVFQLHNLLPHLSAARNVEVVMLGTHRSHRERYERARQLLAELGLGDRFDVEPPKLSGGERQRVAIARALANNPRIILADEPTGNLDPDATRTVLAMLRRRAEAGAAVVAVTHDPLVLEAADRIVTIVAGRCIDTATVD